MGGGGLLRDLGIKVEIAQRDKTTNQHLKRLNFNTKFDIDDVGLGEPKRRGREVSGGKELGNAHASC